MNGFDYAAPATLAEALVLLRAHRDRARILSGGTDLVVQLRERRRAPACQSGYRTQRNHCTATIQLALPEDNWFVELYAGYGQFCR